MTTTGHDPIIEINDVSKSFDGEPVLSSISLSIRNGEFLTFLGPSGCGKTTLLRLIAGFETPTSGDIVINGQRVNDLPPHKRDVNTVFQSYALFPHMTVFDNVAFGLRRKGTVPRTEIADRVAEALALVKLSGLELRKPHQLSGGQQQRVALARAAVNQPLVLLLDEPLSALDFKLRKQMQTDLKALQRTLGITFVFVTHDQEEAFSMSDRVAVMDHGVIKQLGTPQNIYEEPENLFVARFVGDINVLEARITGPGPAAPAAAPSASAPAQIPLLAAMHGFTCPVTARRPFAPGERAKVLLRPEDLRLYRPDDPEAEAACLRGTVEESVYKGATVDIKVRLPDGFLIQVTEFFNEDAEVIDYRPGEPVVLAWVAGWETVLPLEGEDERP